MDWTCAAVKIKKVAERLADRLDGVYKDESPPSAHPTLRNLTAFSGIKFVSEPKLPSNSPGSYTFQHCSPEQLDRVALLLHGELHRYTRSALDAAYLEQIVICAQVRCGDREHGGFSQLGATTIDSIYIDAEDLSHPLHLRRLIHHELFHAFDFHYALGWNLDAWNYMNPSAFVYDARHLSRNEYCSEPGFLTYYSKADAREDRADLFSYLMLHYNDVMARCEDDVHLRAKVQSLKEILAKLSPDFSDDFWKSVAVYCAHDAQAQKSSNLLRAAWMRNG